jgi:hypothetical protein
MFGRMWFGLFPAPVLPVTRQVVSVVERVPVRLRQRVHVLLAQFVPPMISSTVADENVWCSVAT